MARPHATRAMRRVEPGGEAAGVEPQTAADAPTIPRCWGVLDGLLTGAIWADDATDPRWVVVTELADGTTFVGGRIDGPTLEGVLAELSPASGDLIFGVREGDRALLHLLPP